MFVVAGEFEKAAGLFPKILGTNAKQWEDWVFYFADKGHIKVSKSCWIRLSATRLMGLTLFRIHDRPSFPLCPRTTLS